jgi:DNA adenine methylase
MNIANDAPTRPALRYYGGKWNLAPWIISHFPEHKNYVEPCGGAASVLLQKPRSPLETYNDIDGNVVNFFRVLRDQPNELIRRIRLTPWARAEYELSLTLDGDDVERARRYFCALSMSMNGATVQSSSSRGWKNTTDVRGRAASAFDFTNDALQVIADRFVGVQIECRDCLNIISRFDNDEALIYFDPPYVTSERTKPDWYAYEWTNDMHVEVSELLLACAGHVVISGYACELYRDLYEANGWQRVDKAAQMNGGGSRVESLWLSPRTVGKLTKPTQAALLDGL